MGYLRVHQIFTRLDKEKKEKPPIQRADKYVIEIASPSSTTNTGDFNTLGNPFDNFGPNGTYNVYDSN